jgi:phosphatidylglycerol:prolipoprotein diacylglycerol transferase
MNWINPILLQIGPIGPIGPISIHWYGVMYVLTFLLAYLFLKKSRLGRKLPLTDVQKDNLLICIILGIILGGRLGYVLFYNLPYYLENPVKLIALWEGGLSFHGGLIGTIFAIGLYCKYHRQSHHQEKLHFLPIGDIAALIAPLGILFGRIGNFINAELYGRISPDGNFCLNFPTDPANCRYPSQLFEALGEGLLLFIILYTLSYHPKIAGNGDQSRPGRLGAIFLILYGLIRTLIENFREPDAQIGYLLGGLSLGQILSLLTSLTGVILLIFLARPKRQ